MRIENNINFGSRMVYETPIKDLKNPILKYSINYLENHCGGLKVKHKITHNEIEKTLTVFSDFFPGKNKNGISCFNIMKKLDLTSKEAAMEKLIEITNWLKTSKKMIK